MTYTELLSICFQVARLAAKYNVRIERIKEGRYIVDGKINIFVRVSNTCLFLILLLFSCQKAKNTQDGALKVLTTEPRAQFCRCAGAQLFEGWSPRALEH